MATQPRDGRRVVLVGAVHEARAVLRALVASDDADLVSVVTLDETTAAKTHGWADLPRMAAGLDVPVLRVGNLNAPDSVAALRELRPDLVVCVGWTRLLGQEVLAAPPRGCVGFHASLLPRHRGRAPVNWAIIRGETVTGNTMMLLDPGTDTGDIVDQEPVAIEPDDTCGDVYDRVADAGARMLLRHLPALLAGSAPRRPQDRTSGDLLPRRTPEMGITGWDRTPTQVHDWVRGLAHPYPGAFTTLYGRRLAIWQTDGPCPEDSGAPPGTILGTDGTGVRVAARGGTVRLVRVQEPDSPEEPAATWYARRDPAAGTAFDPVPAEVLDWALGLRTDKPDEAVRWLATV